MTMQRDTLSFLMAQTAAIETEIYQIQYDQITYPELAMVDTTANDYAAAIIHYSSDITTLPEPINQGANDMPQLSIQRQQHVVPIHEYGLGFSWTDTEVNQAMMAGQDLPRDKADAANLAAALRLQEIFEQGATAANMTGFFNNAGVTITEAPVASGGTQRDFASKTPAEISLDVTNALGGIYSATRANLYADTLVLPPAAIANLAGRQMPEGNISILMWLMQNNIYTAMTNRPLRIRAMAALQGAATSGNTAGHGRMVAYQNRPEVLRFHLPMPYQLRGPQEVGLHWNMYGQMRVGGLEVRLPGGMRYVDGVTAAGA